MKPHAKAGTLAPLAVPTCLAVLAFIGDPDVALALFVWSLAITLPATWILGMPLIMLLSRHGIERWWTTLPLAGALGIGSVMILTRNPFIGADGFLLFGGAGVITAAAFKAIHLSASRAYGR